MRSSDVGASVAFLLVLLLASTALPSAGGSDAAVRAPVEPQDAGGDAGPSLGLHGRPAAAPPAGPLER
jgi:hypothetical protein